MFVMCLWIPRDQISVPAGASQDLSPAWCLRLRRGTGHMAVRPGSLGLNGLYEAVLSHLHSVQVAPGSRCLVML